MEKIDFRMDMVKGQGIYSFTDKTGNTIEIYEYIPAAQKEAFAYELAERTSVINTETNVVYKHPLYQAFLMFLFFKYYTNIDVTTWDTEEGRAAIYDYAVENQFANYTAMNRATENDLYRVINMAEAISTALKEINKEENSLSYKVKTSFASLLTDEDLTETLAKSQVVSEKMIDLLGAAAKAEVGNGKPTVSVGDNLVKFSKKKN